MKRITCCNCGSDDLREVDQDRCLVTFMCRNCDYLNDFIESTEQDEYSCVVSYKRFNTRA